MTDLSLLIVTGVGRSGTSLLQSMLHAHSQVAFTKETHFIYNYLLPGYLKGNADFSINSSLKEKLIADNYLKRLDFPISEVLSESTTNDLNDVYYAIHKKSNGIQTFYGDKDPYLVGLIPEVLTHFPNATIVHIIRDPRDVILSRVKSKWGKNNPLWVHLLEYKYGIKGTLNKGENLDKKRYIEVRYENLLKDPESTLKTICSRLNLPFDPAMLAYNLQANKLVSSSEQGWKENISKSLIKNNSNKWKSAFNSWQILYIESVLDGELKELAYHRSSPKNVVSRIIQFCGQFMSKIYAGCKYIKHRNR